MNFQTEAKDMQRMERLYQFQDDMGYFPTYREMMGILRFNSTGSVEKFLKRCQTRNWISRYGNHFVLKKSV